MGNKYVVALAITLVAIFVSGNAFWSSVIATVAIAGIAKVVISMGFTGAGIAEGSVAARIQAEFGPERIFRVVQSLGHSGVLDVLSGPIGLCMGIGMSYYFYG